MARILFLSIPTRRPRRRRPPVAVLLLLIGLIAFQAQAFASLALPCLHETADQATTGCPAHETGALALTSDPAPLDPPLLDCVKCALALALSALSVTPQPWRLTATKTTPPTRAPEHFYQFFPEQPFRPPQSRLA